MDQLFKTSHFWVKLKVFKKLSAIKYQIQPMENIGHVNKPLWIGIVKKSITTELILFI